MGGLRRRGARGDGEGARGVAERGRRRRAAHVGLVRGRPAAICRARSQDASRYRNGLLSAAFLAWAACAAREREARERSSRKAMALMSGGELLLQLHFQAWADAARETAERRVALAGKMYGRYLNQHLAKCFLAWAAHASAEAAERGRKMEAAAAFLCGKEALMLRVYWDAFCAAVERQKADAAAEAAEAAAAAADAAAAAEAAQAAAAAAAAAPPRRPPRASPQRLRRSST